MVYYNQEVMIMKKKMGLILTAVMALLLASCGTSGQNSQKLDSHRWSSFDYNDEIHWRTCLDEGCEARDEEAHQTQNPVCMVIPHCDICGEKYGGPAPHAYDENGTCIRCEEKQHGEGLSYFHADGYYVVSGVGECHYEDIEISAVHNDLPVTEVGAHAFAEVHELKSIIIPDTVKKIGWAAFSGCDGLVSVTLPEGLSDVEGYLFNGCTSLLCVDVPSGVSHIGDRAFCHCEVLERITLPATLEKIDGTPFGSCPSLKNIVFKGTKAQWDAIKKGERSIPASIIVICMDGEIVLQ